MAAKIAVFAYLLNIVGHLILVTFGLLPYPLGPALVVATMLTPPVSFLVAVIAYSVVGLAIYDLGVSRQRFERLSRTDMLSGLLNRRAFLDAFEQARGPVALILFDIDRFKAINDTLGHKAGDDVIVKVAQCLTDAAGDDVVVARIGGEEFASCFPANRPRMQSASPMQSVARSRPWASRCSEDRSRSPSLAVSQMVSRNSVSASSSPGPIGRSTLPRRAAGIESCMRNILPTWLSRRLRASPTRLRRRPRR